MNFIQNLLLVLASSGSIDAKLNFNAVTRCTTDERVQYSYQFGSKVVSLCGGGTVGPLTSLAYRYGEIGNVENEFVARPENTNRFFGTVSPANPGADL